MNRWKHRALVAELDADTLAIALSAVALISNASGSMPRAALRITERATAFHRTAHLARSRRPFLRRPSKRSPSTVSSSTTSNQ